MNEIKCQFDFMDIDTLLDLYCYDFGLLCASSL